MKPRSTPADGDISDFSPSGAAAYCQNCGWWEVWEGENSLKIAKNEIRNHECGDKDGGVREGWADQLREEIPEGLGVED